MLVPTSFLALLIATSAHPQKRAGGSQPTTWIKLCETANAVTKGIDGKDEKKQVNICLTHHERLDDSGMVLMSAAVRQIEGQDKKHFMVMVPLGMQIKPGMQVNIDPKDLWEAASPEQRRFEERDDGRLMSLKLAYTLCHAAGCVAEMEATQGILSSLETSGGFMVRTTNEVGASADFSVSLEGFAQAFEGPPSSPQTRARFTRRATPIY